MEYVKKSIDERALHKREYDTKVNERQMHTTEGKVDMSTTLAASLVDTQNSDTESKEEDTSSRSGNDAQADDADIRPIYMMKSQWMRMEAHCIALELKYHNQAVKSRQHGQFLKAKSNEAKVKHDIDVTETINIKLEHKVAKLLKENKTLKKHYKEL
ncbi:hypothetical protein Tco_0409869 [Tanacetum coccineum]